MYKAILTREDSKLVSVFEMWGKAPTFCPIRYELSEDEFNKEEIEALGWVFYEEIEL